jgi:hypothetical protein
MLTLYTVLIIKNEANDVRSEPCYEHRETGKWAGAINLYHAGFFHTTLLSSNSTFDSSEASVAYMNGVINHIRSLNIDEIIWKEKK